MVKDFLKTKLLSDFRDLINSTNIFYELGEHQNRWNLMCVLLDRLDSAVKYLNEHSEHPKTEEEFIFFIVFAAILKDGVYKFYENIYNKKPETLLEKKWFNSVLDYKCQFFSEETCPTDDVFFEYLRSLAFAHPYGTSKNRCKERLFMLENEIHMSPWVMYRSPLYGDRYVGIRIYTNARELDTLDIFFPFESLKSYISQRFNLLKTFIIWGKEAIIGQNSIWVQRKVNRSGNTLNVLKDVRIVLEERFADTYSVDETIKLIELESIEDNKNAVSTVKGMIDSSLNEVCDAVDNLDYNRMENALSFVFKRPMNLHAHAHYELEKIFNYLDDEKGTCEKGSNEEWGLIQAVNFYTRYAKEYVVIDFNTMDYKEIKSLIRISCILGRKKENKGK